MSNRDTVDGMKRQAAAAPYQDGIMELFAAALFIAIALFWLGGRGWMIPLLAVVVVFTAGGAYAWAKRRITYPRIGYAEPKAEEGGSAWGTLAFFAAGFGVFIVAIALTGGFGDVSSWRRWSSFLAGFLCSGGFWYAASVSGLWRYRLIAVYSIVLGLVVSLVSAGSTYLGVAVYSVGMAAVLAVIGVVMLVSFLRSHPKVADSA